MIRIEPDIHGRTFWADHIDENDKYDKIVFLGDYLDVYSYEGITKREAIDNFKLIIDYKREHMDKVVLLIGNHDLPYIWEHGFTEVRHDTKNHKEIHNLFRQNIELFQLAWDTTINGTRYLFTHSGLLKEWLDAHSDVLSTPSASDLNSLMDDGKIPYILDEISPYRGGYHNFGSFVWGDVREFSAQKDKIANIYQIFGHTQLESMPIILDDFACLDVRTSFVLTDDGEIKKESSLHV